MHSAGQCPLPSFLAAAPLVARCQLPPHHFLLTVAVVHFFPPISLYPLYPSLPPQVRVDAIVALRCFVEATEDLSQLRPILPQLLDECFKLMNEVENEDLVFTLETLVEKFGEEISPFAVGLTTNLVQAFYKCIEGGDSADDEEPAGALASLGCLRAIISILVRAPAYPHIHTLPARRPPAATADRRSGRRGCDGADFAQLRLTRCASFLSAPTPPHDPPRIPPSRSPSPFPLPLPHQSHTITIGLRELCSPSIPTARSTALPAHIADDVRGGGRCSRGGVCERIRGQWDDQTQSANTSSLVGAPRLPRGCSERVLAAAERAGVRCGTSLGSRSLAPRVTQGSRPFLPLFSLHRSLFGVVLPSGAQILEIVSYFTYYGEHISEQMWQLWPAMVHALKDWAVDYFENFLVPMDNFISRGTERFLTSTEPNYVEDTFRLCHHILSDENLPDMDCKCAVQLMECVLVNCRGRVDQWVEPFLRAAGVRLVKADTELFLRDLLVGTYANALYYNPQLALAALARLNATDALFSMWMGMLEKRTREGARVHFKREHDKKINALALSSLFALPPGALPESLAQGLPQLLRVVLSLLGDLKEQRAARIKAEAEDSDEEAEDEDGDSDNFVEDDDEEEEGPDKVAKEGQLIGLVRRPLSDHAVVHPGATPGPRCPCLLASPPNAGSVPSCIVLYADAREVHLLPPCSILLHLRAGRVRGWRGRRRRRVFPLRLGRRR